MSIRQQKLPIAALEQIDDVCNAFEQQWQTGPPPGIESVLQQCDLPEGEDVLLAELIALDIDYRRRQGETPVTQDYADRFPDHSAAIDEALNDSEERRGSFEPPTVARLAELFPTLEILELIGAGGMGAVYKARQSGLDRIVALKILPEEFGHDVKFALRFTREARTLAKLTHPNIVSVFEFGNVGDTDRAAAKGEQPADDLRGSEPQADSVASRSASSIGCYYFLMEFVDGSTLRDVVQAGQLAPEHALAIVPHLCDALQYAHDKGVVHRDIKPENILIAADGTVKIADFGLSRILGSDGQQDNLTGTHQVMGTMKYMAPEQLESSRGVDHRADIYSLGVVFYEMLTGELPIGRFAAPSKSVNIDVRLDDVVLRTLEKEPGRRYQHASQIKSDVQSIASSDNPALAKTVAAGTRSSQPSDSSSVDLAEQELAGRMLLTRRQLMQRVEDALRPLFRGQLLQVLFGIALILLGVQSWARFTHVPHRLINGLIVHVYGVVVISQAALVCTRIRRINFSRPVADIRSKLSSVQSAYLRAGVLIGMIWWLMWIPAALSFGFDMLLHPRALVPSLVVGVIGFAVCVWLFRRALKADNPAAAEWKRSFSCKSLSAASRALDEIENARIR